MKRFDVESYVKGILDSHVLPPKKELWDHISEELDEIAHQKRKHTTRIRTGILLVGLFCSIRFTADHTYVGKVFERSADIEITAVAPDMDTCFETVHENLSAPSTDKDKAASKRHLTTEPMTVAGEGTIGADSLQQSETTSADTYFVSSAEIPRTPTPALVSDTELEALLERARTHVGRERAISILRANKAHAMLEEVEKEMERPLERRLYREVKQGYKKFKRILAN